MNVLIVGSGGREHALAWKIRQSPLVSRVFVAPGNAGTALELGVENVDISPEDFSRLIKFAREQNIELTVVGPEVPLVAGLVDEFQKAGIAAFGPSKNAAQLEGSKVFCKQMLRKADVPTADFQVFRDAESASKFITDRYPNADVDVPVVVKADGLAAGKGAIVCRRRDDALAAIDRIARQREFGAAGNQFVIEERLDGEEASVLAITDGRTILTLPPCQDHKPAFDGDKGPNTGGMGAYCPTPLIKEATLSWIDEHIMVPTVHSMKRSKTPFRGVLFAGIMITNQGPKVLEFNTRFGDPECQPLLMRLKSDLVPILLATCQGELENIPPVEWDERPSVCVVLAAEGYPDKYERGKPIRGLDEAAKIPGVKVFHAGTATSGGAVLTNGGRVLGITALGSSISAAKLQAYTAVKCIRFDGAWCRKDISDKALRHVTG